MTERASLILGGTLSLCVAVVGSVTSWSVVQAGGTDGVAYLVVNAGLCALGISLLVMAWRRRRQEQKDDSRPSTSSREPPHPAGREGGS